MLIKHPQKNVIKHICYLIVFAFNMVDLECELFQE